MLRTGPLVRVFEARYTFDSVQHAEDVLREIGEAFGMRSVHLFADIVFPAPRANPQCYYSIHFDYISGLAVGDGDFVFISRGPWVCRICFSHNVGQIVPGLALYSRRTEKPTIVVFSVYNTLRLSKKPDREEEFLPTHRNLESRVENAARDLLFPKWVTTLLPPPNLKIRVHTDEEQERYMAGGGMPSFQGIWA